MPVPEEVGALEEVPELVELGNSPDDDELVRLGPPVPELKLVPKDVGTLEELELVELGNNPEEDLVRLGPPVPGKPFPKDVVALEEIELVELG